MLNLQSLNCLNLGCDNCSDGRIDLTDPGLCVHLKAGIMNEAKISMSNFFDDLLKSVK